MDFGYVTKMTYSKDKDLVFVHKQNGLWNEHETVYEVHHLEQMVPASVAGVKNLSMQREDGILTVHCMATKNMLKFYNEDRYWNVEAKEEFMNSTNSLWRGYADKNGGRIFNSYQPLDANQKLMVI